MTYNWNKNYDEASDRFGNKIALIIFSIFIIYHIFDYFFPEPSLTIYYEAKKIDSANSIYYSKINNIYYDFFNYAKKHEEIKSYFSQDIENIKQRANLKSTIANELYKRIVKNKERFNKDEHEVLIEQYYEINDLDKLNNIMKKVLYLNTIIETPDIVKSEIYLKIDKSIIIHNKLKAFYSQTKNKFTNINTKRINDLLQNLHTSTITFKSSLKEKRYISSYESAQKITSINLKFKTLNTSNIKILKDLNTKFYIQVGRTTWCNSDSSRCNDFNHLFEAFEVTRNQYELALKNFHYYNQSFEFNRYEKQPSSHNVYEYWLNDNELKYFHKYTYIINNEIIDSDKWEEVTPEYYFSHIQSLGSEIYSKPYGYLEENASNKTLPIGGNFVGNEYYGNWHNNIWIWKENINAILNFDTQNYTKKDFNNWNNNYDNFIANYENNHSEAYTSSSYSSSSGGSFNYISFGNNYYTDHYEFRDKDIKNFKNIKNTSSSHMNRGSFGGGK